ncbi:helix-turn-helix domain-containing protein [Paracoccus niistensis]|uniref:Helix-turn-helix domain-containing protein n=1 Tax=Paracoccus niistensis TaxID=632935 RepID=A0ABV6I248_9RHOB
MAFDTLSWAMKQQDLHPTTQLVLIKLADCRNKERGQCDPSQKRLAQACNLSVSTINAHLRILEDKGLIRRIRRFDPKTGAARTTQYEFPQAHEDNRSAGRQSPAARGGRSTPLRAAGEAPSSQSDSAPPAGRKQTGKGTGK